MKTLKQFYTSQAGFTLVEITVTLVILGIVLATAGTALFFGNRMYSSTEVKNTEKYIGDSVYKYIEKKITYGTDVLILAWNSTPTESATYPNYLVNYNGTQRAGDTSATMQSAFLYKGYTDEGKNPEDILGSKFYGTYTMKYTVTLPAISSDEEKAKADKRLVTLKVIVIDKDGKEVYSTEGAVKNLNSDIAISGTRSDAVSFMNPVIGYHE